MLEKSTSIILNNKIFLLTIMSYKLQQRLSHGMARVLLVDN